MKCRVCKIEKEIELFPWAKVGARRSSRCKDCQKILSKKHYQNNKKYYQDKEKIRREKYYSETNKLLYDYLIEHPCVKCGESEPLFLDFDHCTGTNDKIANISVLVSIKVNFDKILKEIEKCQVLCLKCHRIKTAKEGNWYKYQRYIEKQNLKN